MTLRRMTAKQLAKEIVGSSQVDPEGVLHTWEEGIGGNWAQLYPTAQVKATEEFKREFAEAIVAALFKNK